MARSRHNLRSSIMVVVMLLLITSTWLWSSQSPPGAYAISCGTNCENVTNTPTVTTMLNGSDQTLSYTLAFSLNNTAGLGWNVTITSTQFTTGTTPTRTLPTNISAITGVTAVCSAGQTCTTMPTNTVVYPVSVPAGNPAPTPIKFYNAASATGVGTFDISTATNVTIPANAYAGTYKSTITLAYVSGP